MGPTVRAWVDGELVDPAQPTITAIDHGITVGDGVFETMKVVEGRHFALTRHLDRLDRSLAGMGLPAADRDRIHAGADAVLAAGPRIDFGRLRVTLTGGPGPLGSDRTGHAMTYIVSAVESARHPEVAPIVTVPWTRNERSALAGLKTTSYGENVVALARAKAAGASEAILANTRDELCEGTGSNIFVAIDGVLRTPPLESGCLAGITRELMLEWWREAGLEVREETLPMEMLRTADEVFLTNSSRDVGAVSQVDDRVLDAPGPLTKDAAEIFAARSAEGMDP